MIKRRRQEAKTDYRRRMRLLKFGKRIVFRKTNQYIIGQFIESKEAQDHILSQAHSRELLKFGWPKAFHGSLKSLPAAYLTGMLLGKRMKERFGEQEAILDLGLLRNIPKSRIAAFAKGVVDAGIKLRYGDSLPTLERIQGTHMKKDILSVLTKVSKEIEHD